MHIRDMNLPQYEKRREQLRSNIFTFKNYASSSDLMNLRLIKGVVRNTYIEFGIDPEMNDKDIVSELLSKGDLPEYGFDEEGTQYDPWNREDGIYAEGGIKAGGFNPQPIWTSDSPNKSTSFEEIYNFFNDQRKDQWIETAFSASNTTDTFSEMAITALSGKNINEGAMENVRNAQIQAEEAREQFERLDLLITIAKFYEKNEKTLD